MMRFGSRQKRRDGMTIGGDLHWGGFVSRRNAYPSNASYPKKPRITQIFTNLFMKISDSFDNE